MRAHVGRGVPLQSRVGAKPPGLAPAYMMFALLVIASPALAQGVEVTASLDITDGWARVGAYVPVTFKVTNRTDKEIAEVFVTTGGPVDIRSEWRLAPGETGEKVLPIYYTGADVALAFEFCEANGHTVALTKTAPPEVRALSKDTAVVTVPAEYGETDAAWRERVSEALGVRTVHVLRTSGKTVRIIGRSGLEDAHTMLPLNEDEYKLGLSDSRFPEGTRDMVQPDLYRLFESHGRGPAHGRRLWLWLGLFSLAVLVASIWLPRRHAVLVAAAMLILAAGTTAVVWIFGDMTGSDLQETRIFYKDIARFSTWQREQVVCLRSWGGATASYELPPRWTPFPPEGRLPYPRPVLAHAQDLFRPQITLFCGEKDRVETQRPVVVLQTPDPVGQWEYGFMDHEASLSLLLELFAGRANLCAVLLIEGDRGVDTTGRAQALDAWVGEWQGSEDPDVAFAGRSLKWWNRHRREGDTPFMVVWSLDYRDFAELPAPPPDQRLPALVVYSESPKAATRE